MLEISCIIITLHWVSGNPRFESANLNTAEHNYFEVIVTGKLIQRTNG